VTCIEKMHLRHKRFFKVQESEQKFSNRLGVG